MAALFGVKPLVGGRLIVIVLRKQSKAGAIRGGQAAMAAPLFGPFKKRTAISSSLDTYIPWTVVSSILVVSAVLALDVYVRVFQ